MSSGNGHDVPYAQLAPYLRALPQHIMWKEMPRVNKKGETSLDKVPISLTGKKIRAGDGYSIAPELWSPGETAIRSVKGFVNYNGIGVVLGPVLNSDEFIGGFDFDNCFNTDRTLRDWAAEIIGMLSKTYLEVSPSGSGIKAFFRGKLDQRNAIAKALGFEGRQSCKHTFVKKSTKEKGQQIEIYLGNRYFTETGMLYATSAKDVTHVNLTTFRKIAKLLPKQEAAPEFNDDDAPAASLEELKQAVMSITPNEDVGDLSARDVWLRIMMGVHHETQGSDDGFAIVREWSQQSDDFDEAGLWKQWKGFKNNRDKPVTAGTIFHIAAAFGFEREHRVPESSKLFAGMTMKELIEDICFVGTEETWWSHSRVTALNTTALNTALSALRRPTITSMDKQPKTFTSWMTVTHNVATYATFTHRGGQSIICEASIGAANEAVNRWRPPPPVPEEIVARVKREGIKAVATWIELTACVCNNDRTQMDQLLDCAAGRIAHPEKKPGFSIIMQSDLVGIGKDMWSDGIVRALNYQDVVSIDASALDGGFNAYAEAQLVILGEPKQTTFGSMTKADMYNKLLRYTSNRPAIVQINRKHMAPYNADNLSWWIISTNEASPMAIPTGDRRWYIVEGIRTLRDTAFYAHADAWLNERDTGFLIRAFLQQRWDSISEERRAAVYGQAPMTDAKNRMVEAGIPPLAARAKETIENGEWPNLMTGMEIISALMNFKRDGLVHSNAYIPSPGRDFAKWVETIGVIPVPVSKEGEHYPSKVMRGVKQTTVRLYATRNHEVLKRLSPTELGKLYSGGSGAKTRF